MLIVRGQNYFVGHEPSIDLLSIDGVDVALSVQPDEINMDDGIVRFGSVLLRGRVQFSFRRAVA